MTLTGAEAPPLLQEDAPVLSSETLRSEGPFYLVGLIGGKEVGKSALVNALAGRELSRSTSHGTGTDRAIAYLHASQLEPVRALLEEAAPGRYELASHEIEDLRRQVLLDLPDIDSHYADHVAITRRLLRHMLFPLWIQSVEKYADRKPQALLAEVAAGNAMENFIFCLNKADQVIDREGEAAAEELRADFAQRLARTLGLEAPPPVRLISATHPDRYDLPELRRLLGRHKSTREVDQSRRLASQRQAQSLLQWIERQDVPGQLARLEHLQESATEWLSDRLIRPLLEESLPRLLGDPAWRNTLAETVMEQRLARWPIVNWVHLLLAPLTSLARTAAAPTVGGSAESLVASALGAGTPLPQRIQSAFAHLQQTAPALGGLYHHHKLWEAQPAEQAAAELRGRLAAALQQQRDHIRRRLDRSWGLPGMIGRWGLTVGVAIWFIFRPILQPLLHGERFTPAALGWAFLQLLRADFLLVTLVFLILYYLILWLILRRRTHQRIARLLKRWRSTDRLDPAMNLAVQTVQWSDELLAPLALRRDQLRELVEQIEQATRQQ